MSDDWTDLASCKHQPPSIFFPPPGNVSNALAKAICASCPVKTECLDFALRNHEQHGIFGGMTPGERQRLEDGARIRDLWCSYCARPFTIWWERGKKPPVFCSERCRRDARAESHRKSHVRTG